MGKWSLVTYTIQNHILRKSRNLIISISKVTLNSRLNPQKRKMQLSATFPKNLRLSHDLHYWVSDKFHTYSILMLSKQKLMKKMASYSGRWGHFFPLNERRKSFPLFSVQRNQTTNTPLRNTTPSSTTYFDDPNRAFCRSSLLKLFLQKNKLIGH